jgi:hypothetical protein
MKKRKMDEEEKQFGIDRYIIYCLKSHSCLLELNSTSNAIIIICFSYCRDENIKLNNNLSNEKDTKKMKSRERMRKLAQNERK